MAAAQVLPAVLQVDIVEELLAKIAKGADILPLVEARFETFIIDSLVTLGYQRAEVHSIVIPARTLQHRRSRKERLSVDESDRVVRLLRVFRLTEEIYGSRERAFDWLRRPNPNLDPALRNRLFAEGGPSPLSLLKTSTGARMVEALLIQIDEGIYI